VEHSKKSGKRALIYKLQSKGISQEDIDLALENESDEIQEEKDRKLKMAYEGVLKYPEYRQQSLDIQCEFKEQFAEISQVLADLSDRLAVMEEHDMRRERNQLREKLVQSYNFYTSIEKNPSQSWTNMEADAFWELYKDYRDAKGNGFVEDTIKPAMEALKVTKVY